MINTDYPVIYDSRKTAHIAKNITQHQLNELITLSSPLSSFKNYTADLRKKKSPFGTQHIFQYKDQEGITQVRALPTLDIERELDYPVKTPVNDILKTIDFEKVTHEFFKPKWKKKTHKPKYNKIKHERWNRITPTTEYSASGEYAEFNIDNIILNKKHRAIDVLTAWTSLTNSTNNKWKQSPCPEHYPLTINNKTFLPLDNNSTFFVDGVNQIHNTLKYTPEPDLVWFDIKTRNGGIKLVLNNSYGSYESAITLYNQELLDDYYNHRKNINNIDKRWRKEKSNREYLYKLEKQTERNFHKTQTKKIKNYV